MAGSEQTSCMSSIDVVFLDSQFEYSNDWENNLFRFVDARPELNIDEPSRSSELAGVMLQSLFSLQRFSHGKS